MPEMNDARDERCPEPNDFGGRGDEKGEVVAVADETGVTSPG
jgi:hypothetical protein